VGARTLTILLREKEANWQSLRQDDDPGISPDVRARFLGAWDEHRRIYGYTLLGELPFLLREGLANHPELAGIDYDLLVIDEYQDLNACDLEVIRLLAGRGCAIVAAGDDDQSIYSFRKAAPEGIRRFPDDFPGCADYQLSITRRCAQRIVDWARFVIAGDPGRHPERLLPRCADGAPLGEVALLAFDDQTSEASVVVELVASLRGRGVAPDQILILLRGDHNEAFSGPIKAGLQAAEVPVSDSDAVKRMLTQEPNRRVLAACRLLADQQDSLAWATILHQTPGVGEKFTDYIYNLALNERSRFGEALLGALGRGFAGGPRASGREAVAAMRELLGWAERHRLPVAGEERWGGWILDSVRDLPGAIPTEEFAHLLRLLDENLDEETDFSGYLGQIAPLGKDLLAAASSGVRIMTLNGAKGLTVRATVIAGLKRT